MQQMKYRMIKVGYGMVAFITGMTCTHPINFDLLLWKYRCCVF